MKFFFRIITLALLGLSVFACQDRPSTRNEIQHPTSRIVVGHNGTPVRVGENSGKPRKNGTVEVLKGMKLADYPGKTIGEALDRYDYFSSKEWSETRSQNKKVYIDFCGLKKSGVFEILSIDGIYSQGVNIKFAILPDGNFFVAMVSRVKVMSDGRMVENVLEDKKTVLDSIFANKELSFY